MSQDRVTVDLRDGVADVRLSRPDKMNALDEAMFAALVKTATRLAAEPGLRAVVLSGEGRAFCAGLDTARFHATAGEDAPTVASSDRLLPPSRTAGGANPYQQAVLGWRELPVPVIAAVHGVAFGGGFQLTLGADLRFVAADARLSIMEVKWGLVPDMGAFAILPRLVRDDVARDLTFSGRIFTGEEALRLGLATRLSGDPRAEALAYARDLANRNPHALRAAKRLFDVAATEDQAAILLRESKEQVALIGSPNQVEAIRSNLESRAPRFQD